MTIRVGALELPVVPSSGSPSDDADPTIVVLRDFFRAVLEADTGTLCQALLKEPVVRRAVTHDPESADFGQKDTPILAVFRMGDADSEQRTDDEQATTSRICIEWICPKLQQMEMAKIHPFFNAWKKAIENAVLRERHRSWVHKSDVGNVSAEFWGSSIIRHAGLDSWEIMDGGSKRIEVSVPIRNASPIVSDAYRLVLAVVEVTSATDDAFSQDPTVIDGRLVSSDEPETRIERQHFRVPLPEEEP